MFALLGTGEVLALLVIGGFVAPMFMTPSHRGGPLLLARRVEIHYDRWPAVLIMAAHGGLAAWLLKIINKAPWTCLEVGPTAVGYHIGGIYRSRTGTIPLTDINDVRVERHHPMFHIAVMSIVGFVMLVHAMNDRLTWSEFGKGSALVALFSALAAVQSTNNLVFEIEGRKTFFGRKKLLLFPFSTLSLNSKYPAVTHARLSEVEARIKQLVGQAKAQTVVTSEAVELAR